MYGQEASLLKYPKGIYATFASYQNQKPTDTITEFRAKSAKDSIKHHFYTGQTHTFCFVQ